MNNEIETLWKQPTLENLDLGVRLHRGDNGARVHGLFAHLLFATSDALPMKASAETLKLETARKVVWAYHRDAEAAWQTQGFITKWSPNCLEGIAREMADKLARHPIVANVVAAKLDRRRDVVFADPSLTHGDAMFVARNLFTANMPDIFRELLEQECIAVIKEDADATITRALDHLEDLRSTGEYWKYTRLHRILSSLKRVHSVVFGI
ncbi:hypothetical protein [Blastomonas sp.]|uniref:hypothetical protein n=1 Tax=Blastomonas sp. TaxID=1909299 RepID=UPI00262AD572|nr:hypothetical protein [Blastomonas sp.]MDM7956599.1 hypothetical protein [Blastomonas sp.]